MQRAQPRHLPSVPLISSHQVLFIWIRMPFVPIIFFLSPWPAYPPSLPSYITEIVFWVCGGNGREMFFGWVGVGGIGKMSPWLPYFSQLIIPYLLLFTKDPSMGCTACWMKSNTLGWHLRPSTIYPLHSPSVLPFALPAIYPRGQDIVSSSHIKLITFSPQIQHVMRSDAYKFFSR